MPLDEGGIRAQRIAVTQFGVEVLVFEPGSLAQNPSLHSNHWTAYPICPTVTFVFLDLMLIDTLLCIKPVEEDRVSLVFADELELLLI